MYLYRPMYRPAGFATLPPGLSWNYAEAPAMYGLANRPDLPQSRHTFGIISTERQLTDAECRTFELKPVDG